MGRFAFGGEWEGHYVDPFGLREREGQIYRVRVVAVERDGKVDGAMTDLEPEFEVPYRRYLNGLPPKEWAKAEGFARGFKGVTVRLCLPERANLTGTVKDDRVRLVKRYAGPQTAVWLSEGKEILKETQANPVVVYEGSFDRNGEVVDGRWTAPRRGLRGLFGGNEGEGTFHLARRLG